MLQIKHLQSVFLWFFILGQNNYLSIFNSKSRTLRILYSVFRGIFLISISSLIIVMLYNIKSVIDSVSFTVFIPNFLAIIESWFFASSLSTIISDINDSLDYLENNMNAKIYLNKFVRNFHKKIIFSTMILVLEFIYKFLVSTPIYNFHSNLLLTIACTYKHFTILHAIFFIDLQKFILFSINDKINPPQIDKINKNLITPLPFVDAMQALHHMKITYLKVSRISENINKRFGYLLLFFLIHFPINVIHLIYSIFFYIFTYSNYRVLIIRKLFNNFYFNLKFKNYK